MGELLFLLAPAPFAYRLGAVVRDGREHGCGGAYVLLSTGIAFVSFLSTGSVLFSGFAGFVPVVMLAYARFLSAHRLPAHWEQTGDAVDGDESPTSPPHLPPGQDVPDPLRLGMAFIGDVLDTADQLGELRHKRRLRRLERLRAEREAAQVVPLPAPAPPRERYIRVGARRDPIRLLPRPKDPQEPSA
jgi:hypothetical protein